MKIIGDIGNTEVKICLVDKNFNKNSVYIVSDDKIWKDILKENQTIHLIKELDGFRIFAPYYFK